MAKSPRQTKKKLARSRVHRSAALVQRHAIHHARRTKHWYQRRSFWHKVLIWLVASIFLLVGSAYSVAQWYIQKHKNEPLTIGASFIPQYARYLGLEPKATMNAMIGDLGLRQFRLVSYWNIHEPEPGLYDFSELDWQFDKVEAAGGNVSLAIGLRQPRWPECHWPEWAKNLPKEHWQDKLNDYITVVVERYKDRPSLESYQLENEYFLEVFGECPDHERQRLVDEFNLVRHLDPSKPIIVSRSNNAVPSWPVGEPRADIIGASIYKRVWDRTVTKRYFEYPFPAWFYTFLAGAAELTTGRNTIIHELQTEPWPPTGILDASLEEQDKSMSATDLADRIQFGVDTGIRTIDLWGVEWWYWRKIQFNDPSLWDVGKAKIHQLTTAEGQCSHIYYSPPDGFSKSPC